MQRSDDFRRAILGVVFHCDDEAFCADRNIHRATDVSGTFGARHAPVRQVTCLRDLQSAEDANIEMPAASHHVGIYLREKRSAGNQRYRDFHRVYQIVVFLARYRAGAHT